MLEARTDREIGDQVGRSTKAVRCKRLNLAIALFAARWRQNEIALLEILIIMHLIPRVGGWTTDTDRSSPSSMGNSSDRQHSPYRPPPPEPVVCRNHSRSM